MKEYTFYTDDFGTIKNMVHKGELDKLELFFSWKHLNWFYKGYFSA